MFGRMERDPCESTRASTSDEYVHEHEYAYEYE
jgi:hypothetical protein